MNPIGSDILKTDSFLISQKMSDHCNIWSLMHFWVESDSHISHQEFDFLMTSIFKNVSDFLKL